VYEGVKESLQAIQKSRDGASNQETQALKMAVLSNKPVGPFARDRRSPRPGTIFLSGIWRQ